MAARQAQQVEIIGGDPQDSLRQGDLVVSHLQSALHYGSQHLSHVPALLKRVIKERAWRMRKMLGSDQRIEFHDFVRFVTDPEPGGLGTTTEHLSKLCREDIEALDLLDQAMQRPRGNHKSNTSIVRNTSHPGGNSRKTALRRLRKHNQDLHSQVIAGELSCHRAMILAGLKHEPTPIEELQRAWNKASKTERKEFRAWIDRTN